MKKKPFNAFLLLIASLFLVGCSDNVPSVSPSSESSDTASFDDTQSSGNDSSETISSGFKESTDDSGDESSSSSSVEKEEDTYNSYYKSPSSYSSSASSSNLNLENIQGWYDSVVMPSTGNSKILVVPVEFTDYTFESDYKTFLQNAFFGDADDTSWESVSSYYYKSSNGKLNIGGTVANKISLNMKLSQATRQRDCTVVSDNALVSSLTSLAKTMDLSEYDSNNDGYIDAVWLVNSAPYSYDYDITWAYTYWYFEDTTFDGLKISSYSWASIEFLREDIDETKAENSNADCHTMIHETGHLLGLDDYYSYDSETDCPVGCLDMMDYNVGDHMEFSKYLLGWTEPVILTEDYLKEVDYTVKVNTSSVGKNTCYILPIQSENCIEDYNHTPYDEYLVVEYYTPTGLDKRDADEPYDGYIGNYTTSGIALYHVNARVGKLTYERSGWTWDGYVYDEITDYRTSSNTSDCFYYPIYSNTAGYCYDTSFSRSTKDYYQGAFVSLLPQTGKKATSTYWGNNDFLYAEGDRFMLGGTYRDFVFEDGRAPLFGFEVSSCDTESATLTFSRN